MSHENILSIIIFLGSSVILVSIFQRLGLGSILGYLAAGIIIGPQVSGLITDVVQTQRLSEFGVVFLLFLIGLELQPRKLWSMKHALLGFGGLQILFCTLIFTLAARYFGLSWVSSAVVGFSLSLSSTAFALQSLSEKKVLNTTFGRASFAILLMQDVVAIPALAIIPSLGLANNQTNSIKWTIFLFTLIGMIILSRTLLGPFLRILASLRSRELFTGVTLLIVIGVSFLMELSGLSMALGAFLAGVFLAESEYRHELEADLEPFKGLLMGLFFISVGMLVNLNLLFEKPFTIIFITILYMFVKGLAIFAVGRIMGLSRDSSRSLSSFLVQGGEFAFVIFGVGQSAMVLSPEWLQTLTLIITLSMILSSFVIILEDKIQQICSSKQPQRQYDHIDDNENAVIIAGFGRFGQIFGRIMRSQNINFTAIDHDTEQIELLRRFNFKVYYGDASRKEILEAAGAAKAKYLVIAVEDMAAATQIAETARHEYPQLKIYARARNRQHVFELLELGVERIRRETFESSLALTSDLLQDMGLSSERVSSLISRFSQHDELMLKEQFKVRHDQDQYVDISRLGMEQLAQVLKEDAQKTYISNEKNV